MAARDRLIRKALRERFVVTLTSGETFDGLLIDVDDRTLTLANAHAISGAERVKVDGLLYLPRPVAYMQKPEASG
jgi:small nuclear ribonucleoprotein (snRNP)-like protein